VCGAALIAMEGNIEQPRHSAILGKQRRLLDQLLPQLLALCANRPQALGSRYARIVRIAVHPNVQRRGLGTRLLQQVIADLEFETDAMGASFAADEAT
jgi:tRNA(Met) cytidine acetyltransferase